MEWSDHDAQRFMDAVMMETTVQGLLTPEQLAQLLFVIQNEGYSLLGPTVSGDAITYDEIHDLNDLPRGMTDSQEKGSYRITQTNTPLFFDYNIGARSWKQFLFSPRELLGKHQKIGTQVTWVPNTEPPKKKAFLGIRSCELHAIAIQDKVFLDQPFPDQPYQKRRESTLMIAVNCTKAGNTCFCVSMNTGPEVTQGFDIVLTEVLESENHYFLCQSGSDLGVKLLQQVSLLPWQPLHNEIKKQKIATTVKTMGRTLDTQDIKQKLYDRHNHPHWDDVAQRCVNCANCTLACPTCFCSSTQEKPNLDQSESTQTRVWDSCFSQEITYVHESFVRETAQSRYRQWMTHKLGSWIDQFGTSGCVGCGRCITWCPVGIDITEEYSALTLDQKHENP